MVEVIKAVVIIREQIIGIDVYKRQALSEMKTIATTDPLTGLKNRLGFENSINQCSKTLDPLSHSLAILYLDCLLYTSRCV